MAAVTYDPQADALRIELAAAEGPGTEGEEVHPGVVLMFNPAGQVIAIEIVPASKILAPGALEKAADGEPV